jgi:hypothetical protein
VVLEQVGRGRERHVAGGGTHHDEVHLLRLHARAVQGLLGGLQREVRRRLGLIRDVPLADPRALDDPFVGGLDRLLQIVVGEDPLRSVRADADNPGSRHSRPPSRPSASTASASSAVLMCSFTSFFTHSVPRGPVPDGFHWEAPWQMMEAPDPEERRAAHLGVVDPALHAREGAPRQRRARQRQDIAADLLPDHLRQHLGQALRDLEAHVASESVGDHHARAAIVTSRPRRC